VTDDGEEPPPPPPQYGQIGNLIGLDDDDLADANNKVKLDVRLMLD
jgi:hypothetical protein